MGLEDFINEIQKNYRCKTMLIVELLQSTWAFKKFLQPLAVTYAGLVPTVHEPDVCHSWRLLTRAEFFRNRASDNWGIDQSVLQSQDSLDWPVPAVPNRHVHIDMGMHLVKQAPL